MNGANSNTSGANVATVAWHGNPKAVSQAARAEIQRDIEVTIENRSTSDIWDKATEPTDKTLIWWPKDPTSGARIGQPQTYDANTSAWVPLGGTLPPVYPPRERKNGRIFVNAGSGPSSVDFESIGDDYAVQISMTTEVSGGGSFASAPANMNNFGWCLVSKSAGAFIVHFFNVPTGGLSFEWVAEANGALTPTT